MTDAEITAICDAIHAMIRENEEDGFGNGWLELYNILKEIGK